MRGENTIIDTFIDYEDTELVLVSHNDDDSAYNWTEATVYVGKRTGQFSLELQARPDLPEMLVAVDDLSLVECGPPTPPPDGQCGQAETQCSSGVCVGTNQLCDGTDDCGDNSDETDCGAANPICSFETECDWYNSGWSLQSGPSPGVTTGPQFDHSTGVSAGHYLLHPSDQRTQSARLTSLVISQTEGASCQLRFYYYMYGDNVGKLTIGTTIYGGDGQENVSFIDLVCL